jgi:hypothetical protein
LCAAALAFAIIHMNEKTINSIALCAYSIRENWQKRLENIPQGLRERLEDSVS